MKVFLSTVFLLGLFVRVASAQQPAVPQSCEHAPAIVQTANFLLAEPAKPSKFWRDNESSDAAFLKIRYGGMSYGDARGLLGGLSQRSRPPQRLDELSLTHANAEDRAAAIAKLPEKPDGGPNIALLGSVSRALILQDGGGWLVEDLARRRAANPKAFAAVGFMLDQIPLSIADLDDETKLAFAKRAEQAGLWRLAHATLAGMADLHELVALIDRMPESELREGTGAPAEKRQNLLKYAVSMADARAVPLDATKQPLQVLAIIGGRPSAAIWQVFGPLAYRAPETYLLSTLLNQTGEIRLATAVATGLLADINAGKLDPIGSPDALVAALAARLDGVLGREQREGLLRSFRVTTSSGIPGDDAAVFVDEAIARAAFAPIMRGEAGSPPDRPALLTSAFEWDRWAKLAGDLTKRQPVPDEDRLVVAQLLMSAGQAGEALDSLKLSGDIDAARSLTHMLMSRLDRRCANLLLPVAPFQLHLYRFDQN